MKYCTQCGQENPDDAIYCIRDGSYLGDSVNDNQEDVPAKLVCKKCGFENSSEAKFCGGCGEVLNEKSTEENDDSSRKVIGFILFFIGSLLISFLYYVYKNNEDTSKNYYMNVNMHHSSEIDMDGETINLSINTNAEWLEIENLEFGVTRTSTYWESERGDYDNEFGYPYEWNRDYAIHPIANVEFLGNRSFKVTISKNSGYNRRFRFWVRDPEYRVSSWGVDIYQKGYKGRVKSRY